MGLYSATLKKKTKWLKKDVLKIEKEIGPGVITGGADNDPAGIVTYTTAGARFGYSLLWVLLLCTPFMIAVQETAARIALVQKKGLASIIKNHYGKKTALLVMSSLAVANIATIGADIAGVAAVIGLVTGTNWLIYVIPVAALVGYLVLFKKYRVIRKLLLALTSLLIVYIISSILARPDWFSVLQGFIPAHIPTVSFIIAIVGIIGTTISPYMLFWQASDELEEHKTILRPKDIEVDTAFGMLWSNIVAMFIIIAAASTLWVAGINIETVAQAAIALQPLAGQTAYILFALGVIVSGFLSLPVLAGSTAYAVSETFGWREGLNKKVFSAKGFYFTFMLSLIVGSFIVFLPVNPVHLLYYTQVLDGFLTPFLVTILLLLSNNKSVMGRYANNRKKNALLTLFLCILVFLDIILVSQLLGIF